MRHAAELAPTRRRTYIPQPEQDEGDHASLTCRATGCSLIGSVSVGGTTGPFLCSFHAHADASQWAAISRAIRDHDWMLGLMADLRKLISQGKKPEALQFAREFWAEHQDMLPNDHEAKHLDAYLYRLHLDLQFRVGAKAKKPAPFVPQGVAWAKQRDARAFSTDEQVAA